MDITPIFRPPYPPKAGFFFFLAFFFSFSLLAKDATRAENTNASFLLFYQPLFEMEPVEAKTYLQQVRSLFKKNQEEAIEQVLLGRPSSDKCQRKGLQTCSQALYFHQNCIPKKNKASQFCYKKAKSIPAGHFQEPIFNRIQWNKFAVGVNYFCNKNPSQVCPLLSELQEKYMKSYLQLMAQRRKAKEQKANGPLPKLKKGQ